MSFSPKVTEQDLIELGKLAEQQKSQRAVKIENKFLKQTHHKILAEYFESITKKSEEVGKNKETY